MKRGSFVVFEGLNGCGKETQINLFSNYLRSTGKAVPIFSTGEPNNFDDNGKRAREILRTEKDPYIGQLRALESFSKNRKNHNKIFGPMLEKGIHVICDRYYYSTMAYQHAQGIPYEKIVEAHRGIIKPDITFIFDTSPEESLRRLEKRDGKKPKRKFDENLEFNKKVYNNYMELDEIVFNLMGDNSIYYINGMRKPDEVFSSIKKVYENFFSN